ncbi:MAG: hypothetical protein K2Y01_05480 [Rhabdochlamydiaceae bacterium]|nr:hypothetical protein [Rhabdochlamydiaceae bacterium]
MFVSPKPPGSSRNLAPESSPKEKSYIGLGWDHVSGAIGGFIQSIQKKAGFAASDFAANLAHENFQRVFRGTPYAAYTSYEEALDAYRNDCRESPSSATQEIAKRMFSLPIWDLAYETLAPYFLGGGEKSSDGFADKFVRDTIAVKESLRRDIGQGIVYTTGLKLSAYTFLFDSHRNGNYPYLAGNRFVNGRKIGVLRHGVPVREWLELSAILPKSKSGDNIQEEAKEPKNLGNSRISEEYRSFLDACALEGKKILYNCLLNPYNTEGDERPRIEALFKLGLEEQYKDTFHFIRIPADGPIIKGCKDTTNLESYTGLIRHNIKELETWSAADFQSWEALSKKNLKGFVPGSERMRDIILDKYEPLLQFAYSVILTAYDNNGRRDLDLDELTHLLREKKQALMMLFCTLLKMCLIKELGITDYNNTCKDAIDRGSMHLVCDFLWDCFLTSSLKYSEDNLRVHAAWPAVMAKTQAILEDRAEWITSFARWIERVESNRDFKKAIFDFCKKNRLTPDLPVDFLNAHKSIGYINNLISKTQGDFTLSRKLLLSSTFDASNLLVDQEPLRKYILRGLPLILERSRYHNLPLSESPESVLQFTNVSEDAESISGELGFFSPDFDEFVGGPVFTISAETLKVGKVEVAVRWKIEKADLEKKTVPIQLSIMSRLRPIEEEFERIEEETDGTEHKSAGDGAAEESQERKLLREQAIREKVAARQALQIKPQMLEDPVIDVPPSVVVARQSLASQLGDRKDPGITRSHSAGSLLMTHKNPLVREAPNRKEPSIVLVEDVVDGNITPPEILEQFPEENKRDAEEVVAKKPYSRRSRMGRDIVLLGCGAAMGSAITSLWSRSFFGFAKSNTSHNDKEPSITNKEVEALRRSFSEQTTTASQTDESSQVAFFNNSQKAVRTDAERKKSKKEKVPVLESMLLLPAPGIVKPDVISSLMKSSRDILPNYVFSLNSEGFGSTALVTIPQMTGQIDPIVQVRIEDFNKVAPLKIFNSTVTIPTLFSPLVVSLMNNSSDLTRATGVSSDPTAEDLETPAEESQNLVFEKKMSAAENVDLESNLYLKYTPLKVNEINARTLDDVDRIAKDSLVNAPGISAPGFSTSFKIAATIALGAAIAYTAVKAYHYFQARTQETVKKETPVVVSKAPEVALPQPKIKTLKEKIQDKALLIRKALTKSPMVLVNGKK